nr:NifU family protein [Herpetosiphonaceae bacterium]
GGLERMLELIWETGPAGEAIIQDVFVQDDHVAHLLLLHGLHPLDLETRVIGALEKVRPYLKTHGGNVELLDVNDGVVRLRLEGSCHGCPSSALTLKSAIETRIYDDAPDVTAIEVEGVVEQAAAPLSSYIPLELVAAERSCPPTLEGSSIRMTQ